MSGGDQCEGFDQHSNGDIFAIAIPRVKAVFSGEVRWSEASNGDKAIWHMRPRFTDAWNAGIDVGVGEGWPTTLTLAGYGGGGGVCNGGIMGQIECAHWYQPDTNSVEE